MIDPNGLYEWVGDVPELDRPVLITSLGGFMDAGGAGKGVVDHVLENVPHDVIARFDVDLLLDYRARRPEIRFVEDHFESYDTPELVLRLAWDAQDTPFLLLSGPEPDVMWERFSAAIVGIVERLGVRLTINAHGIPMAVPHTRPLGITMHATRKDLVTVVNPWRGEITLPSSIGALLQLRLGEAGHDAMGVVAHVPHYLSETDYPDASLVLLRSIELAAGLSIPDEPLVAAAETTRRAVEEQVADSDDVGRVVKALETQYDAYTGGEGSNLLAGQGSMPTADELGEQVEKFLADLDD
jgi:hypothetical protein